MTKKGATRDFSFSTFAKKINPKIDIFLPNKKNVEKKKLRPPDWPQSRPPAGQETNFFFVDRPRTVGQLAP